MAREQFYKGIHRLPPKSEFTSEHTNAELMELLASLGRQSFHHGDILQQLPWQSVPFP